MPSVFRRATTSFARLTGSPYSSTTSGSNASSLCRGSPSWSAPVEIPIKHSESLSRVGGVRCSADRGMLSSSLIAHSAKHDMDAWSMVTDSGSSEPPRGKLLRNLYIAIEGVDGTGKSTTARRLRLALEAHGKTCFSPGQHSWLDPDATRVISAARAGRREIQPTEIDVAFRRDFALLQRHCIAPALRHGAVVQDRSYLSMVAYGAALYGVPAEAALAHYQSTACVIPDLMIFLDVSADEALARISSRDKQRTVWEERDHIERLVYWFRKVVRSGLNIPNIVTIENPTDPNWSEQVERQIMPRIVALGQTGV
jgi:dTMP kinase